MISVIIPVYNGGEYFRRCIQSLARQDAEPGSFEVIVLDNQSTDGCLEALLELPERISRRVVGSSRLLPIEENWRRIVDLPSTGPFITVVGHDDELEPEFVRLANGAIAARENLCLLLSHFRLIDAQGETIRACRPMASQETAGDFLAGRLANIRDSFGTGYVIRFDEYRRVGGFPMFSRLLFADDALWLSLARGAPIQILKEQSFSYRLHPASASHLTDSAIFLGALSAYSTFLAQNMLGDPGVRRALELYGVEFVRHLANSWMAHELVSASAAGRPARPEVIDRWREVAARFAGMVGKSVEPLANSTEYRFYEWTNSSAFRRRLSQERGGQRLLRLVHRMGRRASSQNSK